MENQLVNEKVLADNSEVLANYLSNDSGILSAASNEKAEEYANKIQDLHDASVSNYMDHSFKEPTAEEMMNYRIGKPKQLVREYKKIGRNEPCPCGSGKKYKNCCLSSGKYEQYELAIDRK